MLKDELSKLPPYNYYLLFAITCHLSLLHSYVDSNKMNYQNLCICFQPCLKIDGFCFQFLVRHWKHCWQGCWTEKEALAEEYRIMDCPPSSSAGASTIGSRDLIEERAISTSDSSKAPSLKPLPDKSAPTKLPMATNGNAGRKDVSSSEVSTLVPSTRSHQITPPRTPIKELAPLSPLLPISPLNM